MGLNRMPPALSAQTVSSRVILNALSSFGRVSYNKR